MKTFKALYLTLAFLAIAGMSKAQDVELGILLGAAQYQGDLTESQITLSETKLGLGALARYYFNPRLNVKVGLYQGWIAGDDANYSDDPDRRRRNLSFSSSVTELSGHLELNILPYISNSSRYNWSPYVFGGVGVFRFNPKTQLNDQTYELQPLGTEGQNIDPDKEPYSLWQVAIPYGVGVKISLGNFWNLGLEVGQRKLFTDYLDDVSTTYPDLTALALDNATAAQLSSRAWQVPGEQPHKEGQVRGNPDKLDMYIFAGFTLTKTLRKFTCKDF